MSVVDASTVAHLLLGLPLADAVTKIFHAHEDKAAPDPINAEILQTIRAHERRGLITPDRSTAAQQALLELPITRYPTLMLVGRAWDLRHNFTAYDAMYVALAEALDTRLVTADGHLARALRDHTSVEVIHLA